MKQIKLTEEQLNALTSVLACYLPAFFDLGIPTDTVDILYAVLNILKGASNETNSIG